MKVTLFILVTLLTSFFPLHKHKIALLISKDSDVRIGLLDTIKSNIKKYYKKKTDLILIDCIPQRESYDINYLMDDVISVGIPSEYSNRVYLTKGDLTVFDEWMIKSIYGFTKNNASIVSSLRVDSSNVVWQTTNIVIHELGHQFGLLHCDDTACIMTPEGYTDDRFFCKPHRQYLQYLIKKNKL